MKLYIADDRISHHICIRGACGTGKSCVARSLAYQFQAVRWPVIYLDVKREFVSEFWREGDWVLDPGDMRCPRWALEEEAVSEMHAMAMAVAAFPDEANEKPFWLKHPRHILARLLGVEHPTTQQLAAWLVNEEEIDRRLYGTDVAKSLSKESSDMRAGMFASLSEFGRSIRLWPNADEQPVSFSVRRWAQERKGSIFLCSSPDTIDAIRPAQSMLLDMLILATQKYPGPGAFILDEVAQMQKLPKLETAMSLQRSAGNPIVLCFQDIAQLEAHYGKLSQSIASNAYTHIVMRTAEDQSAKHASGVLGQMEIERVRESKPASIFHRGWGRRNYSSERVMNPAVSSGEIQAREDLYGWLAQAGNITEICVPYRAPVQRAPRLIERIITPPKQPKLDFPAVKIPYRTSRRLQTALPLGK